jgi:hypothetical protein
MPDLLTHTLIAFTVCTGLRLQHEWLTSQHVTVAMAGAFIPDLAKAALVVESSVVASLLDLPFSWIGLHTLGGSLLSILIGVTVVVSDERRRVFGLLSLGAGSHLIADALLLKASGRSYAVLWPLTQYHPPTPGIYHSTYIWPSVVAGALALVTYIAVRRTEAAR